MVLPAPRHPASRASGREADGTVGRRGLCRPLPGRRGPECEEAARCPRRRGHGAQLPVSGSNRCQRSLRQEEERGVRGLPSASRLHHYAGAQGTATWSRVLSVSEPGATRRPGPAQAASATRPGALHAASTQDGSSCAATGTERAPRRAARPGLRTHPLRFCGRHEYARILNTSVKALPSGGLVMKTRWPQRKMRKARPMHTVGMA